MHTTSPARSLACCAAALAGLAIANPAASATRTVCASGCSHTTIQAAVDAANPGDLVLVTDAYHTEADIVVGTSLELAGAGTPPPIVQAAATPMTAGLRVITILPNTIVTIRDLVLRHGEDLQNWGGAIRNQGILTLRRVEVTDSWSGYNGGGVGSYGPLVIEDSVIARNEAFNGGGVYCHIGEGCSSLEIHGSMFESNLSVVGGGVYSASTTVITTSELRGNLAASTEGGGAIRTTGELVILDSDLIDNSAGNGGGLATTGWLTMAGCTVTGNTSNNEGGGLFLDGQSAWIDTTLFDANQAVRGGGVEDEAAQTTIRRSTFRDNSASGDGGGLRTYGAVVDSSVFHGNTTAARGGGIYSTGTGVVPRDSTVSGNQADDRGGGIYCNGGAELANVTITDNDADPAGTGGVNGGGVYAGSGGPVGLRNSIIAGNRDGGNFPTNRAPDCAGELVNHGWSSIANLGLSGFAPACVVTGATPDIGADPGLAPLADNGGPTLTHALLVASPNIDTGDPAGCLDENGDPVDADQRGSGRVATCDRGAYEYLGEPAIFRDDFESGGPWLWSAIQ